MSDPFEILKSYLESVPTSEHAALLNKLSSMHNETATEAEHLILRLERECAELRKQNSLIREQRDAWKTEAEHQYGLVRSLKYQDVDYPVTGALDHYAAGKYPVLKAEPPL